MNHQGRFDVGRQRPRADGVEVALHELAVAARLCVFAAPHAGDVITLERRAQLPDVLGHEPRQRHGQVEPHAHPALAVVLEVVKLLVGLFAPLAGENVQVLQRRRVDGAETVRAIDPPRRFDQPLARDHGLGQVVAKPLQRARFNPLRHKRFAKLPGLEVAVAGAVSTAARPWRPAPGGLIQNGSKSEILSPKQIQMTKKRMTETSGAYAAVNASRAPSLRPFDFCHLKFVFPICLGFRISPFVFQYPVCLATHRRADRRGGARRVPAPDGEPP